MRLLLATVVLSTAACVPAAEAPPGQAGVPEVKPPPQAARWLSIPRVTPVDYPASATRFRKTRVVVRCRIVASGVPENCGVLSQSPQGGGFGEAAVAAVRRGRLDPATISATDIDQTFDVHIVF